jgi:excisionase family DNA binding protein
MSISLLTIPQVAERLQLDRSTVYRLIESGQLSVVDVSTGRTTTGSGKPKSRVRDDVLDAFIESKTRTATDLRKSRAAASSTAANTATA